MSKEVGNHVVIKLDNGEDLFDSLRIAAEKHSIESGIVLSGLGMLQDFETSFFDIEAKEYQTHAVKEAYELVSMKGSLAIAENEEFMPHLHVALGGKDHKLMGGHLKKAKVAILNEITILKLPKGTLSRKMNPGSGLFEMTVQ